MWYVPSASCASTSQYLPRAPVLLSGICFYQYVSENGEHCLDHHFIALIPVPATEWVLSEYPGNEGMNTFNKHMLSSLEENMVQVRTVGGVSI